MKVAGKATSDREILQWEAMGEEILFDSGVDEFRVLPDNVREELSRRNLDRYWVSYHHWKDQVRVKDQPKPSGITVEPVSSSPDLRMQVTFKDPEFHKKWHECWIRPDEIRERSYRGYVPVETDEVEVFCSTPAGPPAITDGQGKTEMVLYKIPNELLRQHDEENDRRFGGRLEASIQETREQVNKIAREASKESPKDVFFDPEKPGESPGTVRWHAEPTGED
jgi:hypothetical protein